MATPATQLLLRKAANAPGGAPRGDLWSKSISYERADGTRVTKGVAIPSPSGVGAAAGALAVAALAAVAVAGIRFGVVKPRWIVEDSVPVFDSKDKYLGRALTHSWEIEGGHISDFTEPTGKYYIGSPVRGSLGTIAPGDKAGDPERKVRRLLPAVHAGEGIIAKFTG